MYKYSGYIYNYDGTDIVKDPDYYEDPDMECDWDDEDDMDDGCDVYGELYGDQQ